MRNPSHNKKILITGATGFVGLNLCQYLTEKGFEVWTLVRNKKKFETLKIPGHVIEGMDNIDQLPEDLDFVIHAAGLVHSFNKDEFKNVNVDLTKNLIKQLKNKYGHHPQFHFILISSLAAIGPSTNGKNSLSENAPCSPVGEYGRSKLQAEYLLVDHQVIPPEWPKTIIRPPMVIGPGDTAFLDIFKMVKKGFYLSIGPLGDQNEYSFICVHDLSLLIEKILLKKLNENANAKEKRNKVEVYFSSFPQKITYRQLMESIGKNFHSEHYQLKKFIIPVWTLYCLSYIFYFLSKFFPLPQTIRLTPDKMKELTQSYWICSSAKSLRDLKMNYEWDLDQTVKATLDYYQQKGLLS